MSISHPKVNITKTSMKKYNQKSAFVTLFIYLDDKIDNQILQFKNFKNEDKQTLNSKDNTFNTSIETYFKNGGDELYVLTYNSSEFNLFNFEEYVKKSCDSLTELETIAIPTLLSSSPMDMYNSLKIISFIGKYAKYTNRIFITDVNQEIIDNNLDLLEESVIYYPNFKDKNENIISSSVVACALMSKLAKEGNFFHSLANKKILSVDSLETKLLKKDLDLLYKESINPIIHVNKEGLKIWGVSAFNSNFKTINELRVMNYIKRSLKSLLQEDLFEINSNSLSNKLFSKVNVFLYDLWQMGALEGDNKNEAYTVETRINETKSSDNTLIFSIGVSLSKPLEFINIKVERIQTDGMVENISIEG